MHRIRTDCPLLPYNISNRSLTLLVQGPGGSRRVPVLDTTLTVSGQSSPGRHSLRSPPTRDGTRLLHCNGPDIGIRPDRLMPLGAVPDNDKYYRPYCHRYMEKAHCHWSLRGFH